MIHKNLGFSFLFLLLISSATVTGEEPIQFNNIKTKQRYQTLIHQLRCLVCQNQNIADSNADLAKDLRRKTANMLKQGRSEQQILDYMQERYGDFILYKPAFNKQNLSLWIMPFLLLLFAFIFFVFYVKTQKNSLDKG